MGKRAAHPGTTDATANHADASTTRVVDRWSELTTGYTISGVARRPAPKHRAAGDILFRGFDQDSQDANTIWVPHEEDNH